MDLPNAKHREKYVELIKELEAELKVATHDSEVSDFDLHTIQQKLDEIAAKYQDDEKIGSARYKLYELQALLHHLNRDNDKALDFINQAIELKGGTYEKAEKLKNELQAAVSVKAPVHDDESTMTKAEKRKKLIGLEGWLAWFIVGQILALLITIFRFFSDGFLSSSDISAINDYQQGLGDTLQALTTLENFMILVYTTLIVTTLVLLFRRRKSAKVFAVVTLVFAALYGMIDYAVASSVFESSGLMQNSEIQAVFSKYSGDVGRSLLAAVVWVPYFIVSKRVKATLTK